MKILITAPSLDAEHNISGISSVARFIIDHNPEHQYTHFQLGREDQEKSSALFARVLSCYLGWLLLMIKGGHDLIHFNLALSAKSVLRDSPLIALARLLNKKQVIHVHGGEFLTGRESPLWMKLVLTPLFAGREPKILLSDGEEAAVRGKFHARRTTVLQNCIDIAQAQAFERSSSDFDSIRLLFMGRISESKGIGEIFEALQYLKESTDFQFTLAGTGPDRELYTGKFADCLGGRFRYAGVVHGREKNRLLRHCNVFLLPSHFEGLPMALLEAMAFGLVPIVTAVGAMKDIVRDRANGMIVAKHSSREIASAIAELAGGRGLMQSLSQSAREYIFTACKPADYILKLNRIYQHECDRELSPRNQQ